MTPKEKPIIQTIDQPTVTPVSAQDQSLLQGETPSKKKPGRFLLVFSVLISVLLFLVILSLFLKLQRQKNPQSTPAPTPIQKIQITDAPKTDNLQQEIENIHREIQNKQILPLPNISLDITL